MKYQYAPIRMAQIFKMTLFSTGKTGTAETPGKSVSYCSYLGKLAVSTTAEKTHSIPMHLPNTNSHNCAPNTMNINVHNSIICTRKRKA